MMIDTSLYTRCIALALLCVATGTNSIEMVKLSKTIFRPGEEVSFLCKADEPLVDCGFQFAHLAYYNFSKGDQSDIQTMKTARIWYYGSGLDQGECGIKINETNESYYNIGCRGRAAGGAWPYDYITALFRNLPSFEIKVKPSDQVYLAGSNAAISCRQRFALDSCSISVQTGGTEPSKSAIETIFTKNKNRLNTNTTQYFYVDDMEHGGCELKISGLTEVNNHWVVCRASRKSGTDYAQITTHLIIAKPPADMGLKVIKNKLKEGEMLEAVCSVGESRPPSNITWYLGDERVTPEDVMEVPNNRWRWGNLDPATRTQILRRQVKAEDHGKDVTCQVTHVGMPRAITRFVMLSVMFTRKSTTDATDDVTTLLPDILPSFLNQVSQYADIFLFALIAVSIALIVSITIGVVYWMKTTKRGCYADNVISPEQGVRMSYLNHGQDDDLYDDVMVRPPLPQKMSKSRQH